MTAGFFPPDSPNPWPKRPAPSASYAAIWKRTLDFLDFHPLILRCYSLGDPVENFEMEGLALKPVIMGEFGALAFFRLCLRLSCSAGAP